MVKQIDIGPVGRILEPRCVKEEHTPRLLVVAAHWAEVAVAGLSEHFPAKVADHVEPLDLGRGLKRRLEEVKVERVDERRRSVVLEGVGHF